MKSQFLILSLFLIFNFGCKNSSKKQIDNGIENETIQIKKNKFLRENTWLLNRGLINVESIIYDHKNHFFYASNGIDYKIGKDGFISKISKNGELKELKWIKGLNRPTGMAIHNNLLYVADINALVIINIENGEIIKKLMEPLENSGLNDVAINNKGQIFVTASFTNSIYYAKEEKLELWIQDNEKLKWANGIIANNERIIVAGMSLNTINLNTKKIDNINLIPKVEDFDGVISDGSGNYFLTTVDKKAIWYLKNGQIEMLKEDGSYFGDLEFIPELNRLYIPRGNHREKKYFITEIELK